MLVNRRRPGGDAGIGDARPAVTVKEEPMKSVLRTGAALVAALFLPLQACTDRAEVAGPGMPDAAWAATPLYTSVSVGGVTYEFWPWTTHALNAADPDDPVNLLLVGEGDPRAVRAALMSLDPSPILGCTWSDAIGDEQASAADGVGWTGSAIQLACGAFGPLPRLHLRLFDIGDAILVGAHYEVQIPGTDQHQVLSYSLAEDLVLNDLFRTGLVNPADIALTPEITTLTHKVISTLIFNSLPAELQALVTGVPGDVTTDVPIPNGDGKVVVAPLAHYAGAGTGSYQAFTLDYDQWIPKPFCQSPGDVVYVTGPVQLAMTVTITAGGTLERHFRAQGRLSVTPPTGPSYRAVVTQDQQAWATGTEHWVQAKLHQLMVPSSGADRGQISQYLRVGTDVPDDFWRTANCGGIGSQ
jgi:hypothetical protein